MGLREHQPQFLYLQEINIYNVNFLSICYMPITVAGISVHDYFKFSFKLAKIGK